MNLEQAEFQAHRDVVAAERRLFEEVQAAGADTARFRELVLDLFHASYKAGAIGQLIESRKATRRKG